MRRMLEVGPNEFLAASIAEGVTGGGISAVRHSPTRRYRHLYDVSLTDKRRVIVRIGLPEEREALAQTAYWTDQLRPIGIPLPEIFARDLESLFPSLVTERLPGSRLGRALPKLSRATIGTLAGTMADQQSLVARLPSSGRFGWASDPEAAPYDSWAEALDAILTTNTAGIRDQALLDPAGADQIRLRFERAASRLDGMLALPFIPDAATATVVVRDSGQLSGLVDINGLCWGDPRMAPASTLMALLNGGLSTAYAEAWLALSGHARDGIFWLYVGIACVQVMGEYGRTDLGTATGSTVADRHRLGKTLSYLIDLIDRTL